jgi:hypothetical protein
MNGQTGPAGRACVPAAEVTTLVPVLVRVVELGRGPPGLMRWLNGQLDRPGRAGPPVGALTRLAAELNQVVRRAGVAETIAE